MATTYLHLVPARHRRVNTDARVRRKQYSMSLFVAWVVNAILKHRYLAVAAVIAVLALGWIGWSRLGGREHAASGLHSVANFLAETETSAR